MTILFIEILYWQANYSVGQIIIRSSYRHCQLFFSMIRFVCPYDQPYVAYCYGSFFDIGI